MRAPTLIDNLMSFGREHAGCGQIEGDVVGEFVEVFCSCGARIKRAVAETSEPTYPQPFGPVRDGGERVPKDEDKDASPEDVRP